MNLFTFYQPVAAVYVSECVKDCIFFCVQIETCLHFGPRFETLSLAANCLLIDCDVSVH